jgi:hypothetical protein
MQESCGNAYLINIIYKFWCFFGKNIRRLQFGLGVKCNNFDRFELMGYSHFGRFWFVNLKAARRFHAISQRQSQPASDVVWY